MRVVIDMQGLQASNAKRGIGRYTSGLVKHMLMLNKKHEILLLVNGLIPESIDLIRKDFSTLVGRENIIVWDGIGPTHFIDAGNNSNRKISELIREDFIGRLNPDILLITSLFEGLGDNAVTSIGNSVSTIPTAVILFDLIPLIHKEHYLSNKVVESWYYNKLDSLKRADLLLSISESSRNEAVNYLGFDDESVVNISTACEDVFRPISVTKDVAAITHQKYKISSPFIMYTGGIDHRKNIEGLIKAFALLPKKIQKKYQLAIVCSIHDPDRIRLQQLVKKCGLSGDKVIFTGYVTEEEILLLYNTCDLFVFPSWHEGFGLPVLEAMKCGKAVLAGNLSSVPEVIGNNNACFNPHDDKEIAKKIAEVLLDDDLKSDLIAKGIKQAEKFTWKNTAQAAWDAIEKFGKKKEVLINNHCRPKLAFISPLPPARSGISDYSAELISELNRHYNIDVIVVQDNDLVEPYIESNCNIKDLTWFKNRFNDYERVLYHFGNSAFHSHMFALLDDYPGIVVLHDFFLSGITAHIDVVSLQNPGYWARELHKSSGWPALSMRFKAADTADVVLKYPCNISVIQDSLGVIVHSEYSRQLASDLYGQKESEQWIQIPLLRSPAKNQSKAEARKFLGINDDCFLVCSFGLLGATKLNDRLLSSWLESPLSKDKTCQLVFVGQNDSSDYGNQLVAKIKKSNASAKVKITGWVDSNDYKLWLTAADVGVQLRGHSRGETSAAVLDCMNYGLATIINANGSMADIPDSVVWKLKDEFTDTELVEALTVLFEDDKSREQLKISALNQIREYHTPRVCATKYYQAIESIYNKPSKRYHNIIQKIFSGFSDEYSKIPSNLETVISNNYPLIPRQKQLFIDISELVQRDAKSGIQRVVRAILNHLLTSPPDGWVVEPVYALQHEPGYRYARKFTCEFLSIPNPWVDDALIDSWAGDRFLGLDLQPAVVAAQQSVLLDMRRRGVEIHFVVYDLLPILMPNMFFDGAQDTYNHWMECISQFDGAVCISQSTAADVKTWIRENRPERESTLDVSWFHLGADLANSVPSMGDTDGCDDLIAKLSDNTTFLMVSTVEPRKCHKQVLDAFEILWEKGEQVKLTIIGKKGWMVDDLVERINQHEQLNKNLFWLAGISDEYLEKIYAAANCLISASAGEGFGLPLIEAAQHNLPIIARNILVFREIAGDNAFYFDGNTGVELADSLFCWLGLYKTAGVPDSSHLEWKTWEQSTQQLLNVLFKK